MPVIDLDYNLEDVVSNYEALPAGSYEAVIKTCELTKSRAGSPMLKIVWDVTDGDFVGRKVFDNVVLRVGWKVKQYAEICGIQNGAKLDTDSFLGVSAVLEVIPDESNRTKIKSITPF